MINDRKDKNLTKFGFIISNNVDKLAVHRNRVKRAMRESARQTMFSIPNGMDMIFIAKQNIVKMTTDEIMKEMKERKKVKKEKDTPVTVINDIQTVEEPRIIEEIVVEELSIDGVCGVY